MMQVEAWKNQKDRFFLLWSLFTQATVHQKNHGQPKCKDKISCPRRLPNLPTPPLKNKGPSLTAIFGIIFFYLIQSGPS